MDEGTPRDQTRPAPVAPEISHTAESDPWTSQSLQPGVPLARMIPTPPKRGRCLKDLEFLLFPLSRGQAITDVAFVLLLALICDIASELVIGFFYGIALDDPGSIPIYIRQAMLFPMLGIRAVTTVGLVAAFVRCRGESFHAVGLRKRGMALDGILGVALTLVVYGLIFATLFLLVYAWPDVTRQMNENALVLLDLLPNANSLTFLCMAITIGIYEELLFRGFIMPRLRRATGSWFVAILLSSAGFTALHAMDQTPAALVIVAILSVSFSVVTIWRRSIVPAIVAHALFDFSQFVFLMLQRDTMPK